MSEARQHDRGILARPGARTCQDARDEEKRSARISPRARKEGGLERAGTDDPRKWLTPRYRIGSRGMGNVIATPP
jgi:hypothetical protein